MRIIQYINYLNTQMNFHDHDAYYNELIYFIIGKNIFDCKNLWASNTIFILYIYSFTLNGSDWITCENGKNTIYMVSISSA